MSVTIHCGDALTVLRTMEAESVHCCVTSPPYFGLRDYGMPGQIGLEPTPAEYVAKMREVFAEVRRVLREDGTLWLNLGDSYANDTKWGGQTSGKHAAALHGKTPLIRAKRSLGLKSKDLIGIPWRVAFALQADGWYLRSDIIWHKPNPMPESVTDRCTKAHEYMFMLAKSERYYFDGAAIGEPSTTPLKLRNKAAEGWHNGCGTNTIAKPESVFGVMKTANKRTVWSVATSPYAEAHFATFPPDLIRPCILAGCPVGGTVLDPFGGSGTTGEVAEQEGRHSVLIELNPEYVALAKRRTQQLGLLHDA